MKRQVLGILCMTAVASAGVFAEESPAATKSCPPLETSAACIETAPCPEAPIQVTIATEGVPEPEIEATVCPEECEAPTPPILVEVITENENTVDLFAAEEWQSDNLWGDLVAFPITFPSRILTFSGTNLAKIGAMPSQLFAHSPWLVLPYAACRCVVELPTQIVGKLISGTGEACNSVGTGIAHGARSIMTPIFP